MGEGMVKKHIVFADRAFLKLSESVANANSEYEVGGVLLGHQKSNTFYVVDLTVPEKLRNCSNISFILDGKEHVKQISEIGGGFFFPPFFIGVWHSHIREINVFSVQDRISNKLLAEQMGPALSVIATKSEDTQEIKLTAYYILKSGKELFCDAEVCDSRLPGKYLKRRHAL